MTERPTSEEAIDWLKRSGEVPDLRLRLRVSAEPDTAAYHRFLEILFSPREEDAPA